MEKEIREWEPYAIGLTRIKVDGGYLYLSVSDSDDESLCFVPDVDLARYQAHLRDAYNQGFEEGREERKHYTQL